MATATHKYVLCSVCETLLLKIFLEILPTMAQRNEHHYVISPILLIKNYILFASVGIPAVFLGRNAMDFYNNDVVWPSHSGEYCSVQTCTNSHCSGSSASIRWVSNRTSSNPDVVLFDECHSYANTNW